VHPGVDTDRFRVLTPDERTAARVAFGVAPDAELIVGVSRLVPRKGFDTAIAAVARMARHRPRLEMVIVGAGRDADRLNKLARSMGAPVRFLGRVDVEDLPRIYGCADIFTMLCRNRWGGLEQEGFGIVFLEAAACGIPQVAGNSGGAAEAVEHNVTGLVVRDPSNVDHVVRAFTELLDNPELRADMGRSARKRAVEQFSYEVLAAKLWNTLRTLP
jgi:phosphatidylinositol alpha-1,6-mannosyltransferase